MEGPAERQDSCRQRSLPLLRVHQCASDEAHAKCSAMSENVFPRIPAAEYVVYMRGSMGGDPSRQGSRVVQIQMAQKTSSRTSWLNDSKCFCSMCIVQVKHSATTMPTPQHILV